MSRVLAFEIDYEEGLDEVPEDDHHTQSVRSWVRTDPIDELTDELVALGRGEEARLVQLVIERKHLGARALSTLRAVKFASDPSLHIAPVATVPYEDDIEGEW